MALPWGAQTSFFVPAEEIIKGSATSAVKFFSFSGESFQTHRRILCCRGQGKRKIRIQGIFWLEKHAEGWEKNLVKY
jgi:hypothetical protein